MDISRRLPGLLLLPLLFVAIPSATAYAQQTPAPKTPRESASPTAGQDKESDWVKSPVRAAKGMVVSDEMLASAAGVEILKRGGNAVDAAVTVAFALAVVEPQAGNIGGGGFMLVRLRDGQSHFVDYREIAPKGSSRDMYSAAATPAEKDASLVGWKAVGVPGTVAGLALALAVGLFARRLAKCNPGHDPSSHHKPRSWPMMLTNNSSRDIRWGVNS